jgi:hypothetical protein
LADGASACFAEEFAADGFYRTLTFIKDEPGGDPSIQPDLAEGLGVSSDNGRT